MSRPIFGLGRDGRVISATIASGAVTADAAAGSTIGAAGVDVVSQVIFLGEVDLISLQALATGDVDGAWAIEWSNNYSTGASDGGYGQPTAAGDWAVESPALIPAPGGDAQNDIIEIQFRAARAVRFRFTPSAGAGAAQLWIMCKGL